MPALADRIRRADAIVVGAPIYNYDVNAALKNLVELTGRAWKDKIVAFLCAAGGKSSYMSVMGLANSLMLDFRCAIVPRFVYATDDDFAEKDGVVHIVTPDITQRIGELATETLRWARALGAVK